MSLQRISHTTSTTEPMRHLPAKRKLFSEEREIFEAALRSVSSQSLVQSVATQAVTPTELKEKRRKVVQLYEELPKLDVVERVSRQPPRLPPPTPRKTNLYAPVSEYRQLYQQAKSGRLSINGQHVALSLLSNQGSYLSVYTTQSTEEIIPEVANETLVIKLFNEEKSTFSERALLSYMRSALENYREAENLGVSVAKIYNFDTALKNKFLIQEKIPYAVDITHRSHFNQVREFFFASLKHKLILDLLPGNLLVRENGVVTLVDFVEESDDGLNIFINHALTQWCRHGTREYGWDQETTAKFLFNLTEGFEEYGYCLEDNEMVMTTIFPNFKKLAGSSARISL